MAARARRDTGKPGTNGYLAPYGGDGIRLRQGAEVDG
jgi:hypothetical protein